MQNLINEMQQFGLVVDTPILDSNIHRIPTTNHSKKKNGWYAGTILNGNIYCSYGRWDTGQKMKFGNGQTEMSQQDVVALRIISNKIQEEKKKKYEYATVTAERMWKNATLNKHKYLEKKGISGYDTRVFSDVSEEILLIPIYNKSNKMVNLQRIYEDGAKKVLFGGEVQGCFYVIPGNGDKICICEGFATGASIHDATGYNVVVAFNTGNLKPVSKNIREKFPDADILVCGDNDESQAGEKYGRAAANAVNGKFVMPDMVGYDFNDLYLKNGKQAVSDIINPEKEKSRLSYITLEQIYMMDIKRDPIIEGIIDKDDQLIIYAPGGTGKSLVTLSMALHLASGIIDDQCLWHKFPIPKPRPSIFIQSENSMIATNDRVRKMCSENEELRAGLSNVFFPDINNNIQSIGSFTNQQFRQDIIELFDLIEQTEQEKIELMFIDPLISFHDAEENDNSRMRETLDNITNLCNKLNCTPVVIHHAKKEENKHSQLRGASAIFDWARSIIKMEPKQINGENCIEFIHEKANNTAKFMNFTMSVDYNLNFQHINFHDVLKPGQIQRCDAVRGALLAIGGTATRKNLTEKYHNSTNIPKRTCINHIKDAVKYGYIYEKFLEQNGCVREAVYFISADG